MISFLLLALFFESRAFAACTESAEVPASGVCAFAESVLKDLEVQRVSSPARYCADALRERFLNSHRWQFSDQGVKTIYDPDFSKAAEEILDNPYDLQGSWRYTFFPSTKVRFKSYLGALKELDDANYGATTPMDTPENVHENLALPMPRNAAILNSALMSLREIDSNKRSLGIFSVVAGFAEGELCKELLGGDSGGCEKALKIAAKDMMPSLKGSGAMAGIEWWRELYQSNKYEEGVRLAALKIQDRVMSKKLGPSDNIFDDLKTSFTATGKFDDAQAEDAAFIILGAIATAGANTSARAVRMDGAESQLSKGLGLIAGSMSYLDSLKSDRGRPLYSFPAEVNVSCDSGKPYHFWMAAALTRKLIRQGIDPRSASAATFITEKIYQILRANLRDEQGKGKNVFRLKPTLKGYPTGDINAVLKLDSYDSVDTIIRADLAYSASGASFGALAAKGPVKPKTVDVDRVLKTLVEHSSFLPGLSEAEAHSYSRAFLPIRSYRRFEKVFQPDAAFFAAEKMAPNH